MLEGETFAEDKVQILSKLPQANWNIHPDLPRDTRTNSESNARRGGEIDENNLRGNICHAEV